MNIAVFPDFSSEAFFADRYSTYRMLREKFPFFRTEIDGEPCIVLTRYADVDEALRHPHIVVQPAPGKFPEERIGEGPGARFYRETLGVLDDPHHTRLRRAVTPAFTTRAVSKMRGWMEEIIESHLTRLSGVSEVEFVNEFASPMTADLASRFLHVPAADGRMLLRRSHEVLAIVGAGSLADGALEASNEAIGVYLSYMDGHLCSLRNAQLPEDDFIGALLAAENTEGCMTHSEAVTTMAGFIAAAYHTAKSMTVNAVLALLRHPDQKEQLIARPDLARTAWEEAARYDGPVHFMHRYASRPLTIGGVSIEPGPRLVLGMQPANRDELQFSNPDRFIIDRPANRHLAFAGGPHFCLGVQIARLEGELLMQRLFQRFPCMQIKEVQSAPARDISFPMLTRLNLSLR